MKFPSSIKRDKSNADRTGMLVPLTPVYDEAQHSVYSDELEAALFGKNQSSIKNVALTGSYGVGKSSVLQYIAQRHKKRVIQISLSTLGEADEENVNGTSDTKAISKTNRIQKEIVKQLIYREDPHKTPGSRFRRTEKFDKWRGIRIAVLVGLTLTVVFYLSGWTAQLAQLLQAQISLGLSAHLLVFLLFTIFVWCLEAEIHNRVRIESLTAGSATISLSTGTSTYFDEFLDEIVYLFSVTEQDIVVFEDIDRFDDPHIFETLRALNTLLNAANQLGGRSVRFIYAIKDSIFDELGRRAAREEVDEDVPGLDDAVVVELARANRTKFFDLVIPVVPFITHRSARDLMIGTMRGVQHDIDETLFDLAARHLADMRLIKNVRNEFVIFRTMILESDGGDLELFEASLFAMMLYKNTHLSDFEAIRSATSSLDRLYEAGRKLVDQNIEALYFEARERRKQLVNLNSISRRSEELGSKLLRHIDLVVRQLPAPAPDSRTVAFQGEALDDDTIQSASLWQKVVGAGEDSEFEIAISVLTGSYPGNLPLRLTISRSMVAEIVGTQLSAADWDETDRERLESELDDIASSINFLRRADMSDLINDDTFKLVHEGSDGGPSESFRELAKRHLKSVLALELIRAGYIDSNFTLYTSTYHSIRVSSRALNYIIRHIDRNIMDVNFQLEPNDVEAIIRERGETVLSERTMYNISILNHLLGKAQSGADQVVGRLKALGEDEKAFLESYLEGGLHQEALIRRLSPQWGGIFDYVASLAILSDGDKVDYLNAALEEATEGIDYIISEAVSAFVEEHYAKIPAFTSDTTNADLARRAVGLLKAGNARLSSLALLGQEVRHFTVVECRYLITLDNLISALAGAETLALDQIREANKMVYDYAIAHLAEYLYAIKELGTEAHTIESPNAFAEVITDIARDSQEHLSEVVSASALSCRLLRLVEVPDSAWPALAEGHRFPATFENVAAYIDSIGEVDGSLANLLATARKIEVLGTEEDSRKVAIAYRILAAKDTLPDPVIRVGLVDSLELRSWLDPSELSAERGPLVGLLIDHQVVEDEPNSFAMALELDWPAREFAISKSNKFVSFMTPGEVPVGDIPALLESSIIPQEVKLELIARVDEFVPDNTHKPMVAIAQFAEKTNARITIDLVTRMANAKVHPDRVLVLLEPLIPEATEIQLVNVLKALGGVYDKLTARNGTHPKLPNSSANLTLLEKLQQLGLVSTIQVSDDQMIAHMKKKPSD